MLHWHLARLGGTSRTALLVIGVHPALDQGAGPHPLPRVAAHGLPVLDLVRLAAGDLDPEPERHVGLADLADPALARGLEDLGLADDPVLVELALRRVA